MKQTVANDNAVVFECELPQPRDKVWRALTERELLAAWLVPNDIRPEVGAKFQLRPPTDSASRQSIERAALSEGAAGPQVPVECEVLEAEAGRLLRWRQLETAAAVAPRQFIESVVSFELSDTPGGGTHLRVVHDGFTTVTRCSTVVALRPRAKAAIKPTSAVGPTIMFCSLRRAA